MQVQDLLETADKVSELMKSLGNPKRLLILCQLVEQERSVSELARLIDMKEPAVSQQLALLRKHLCWQTLQEVVWCKKL